MKKRKGTSVSTSMSRGLGARGTTGVNDNGKEAYKTARKSTRGTYHIEFSKVYENMSEKDLELRKTYAIDLIASHVGVPMDMVHLRAKSNTAKQTLTALDEVFYVKVGQYVYGKLSIRTQRMWKGTNLMFVYQSKKTAHKQPKLHFQKRLSFKPMTKSQKSQVSRKSYNKKKRT